MGFFGIPETREMLIQLIREILIIGQAKKVNIGEDDYEWAISRLTPWLLNQTVPCFVISNRTVPPNCIRSTDFCEGAERLSVDVPALRFIYHCLIPQENLAANPDATNLLQNVFDYLFRYLKSLSCFIRNIP